VIVPSFYFFFASLLIPFFFFCSVELSWSEKGKIKERGKRRKQPNETRSLKRKKTTRKL